MDFKGDRIMDYQVWYLDSYSGKFDGYMRIPLMKAAGNATACTEWLVNNIYSCFIPVSRHSRVYVPPLFLYLFFYFFYDLCPTNYFNICCTDLRQINRVGDQSEISFSTLKERCHVNQFCGPYSTQLSYSHTIEFLSSTCGIAGRRLK